LKNGFETLFVPVQSVPHAGKGTALVLAPHPDDEIIGCGGAILRHVQNNDSVHVIIMTDGGLGDPEIALKVAVENNYETAVKDYVELRKGESKKAGETLNYGIPEFWGIRDRTLEYGEKYVSMVMEQIKTINPSCVYAPSLYEMHPDHRAVAMIAVEAVRRSVGPNPDLIMYEIGRPIPSPDFLLDITDVWAKKLEGIKCFKSQLKVRPFDEYVYALNRFRAYTLPDNVNTAEAYLLFSGDKLQKSVVDLLLSESECQKRMGLFSDVKDTPLVSVIIRTIGRESLLRKALDSVALQIYPNIEIVLVDAKGDQTINVPEWCGRFPVHICCKDKPLSRSEAANVGLDHAGGTFCIFLDDDDWFLNDHIATLVAASQDHPSFQVTYSGVRCIDEEGLDKNISFNSDYDPVRLFAGNYIPIHSVLFRRSLLENGCRFDENLIIYEDWDFWLQISQYTDFYHVDAIGAVYRIAVHEGSKVHNCVVSQAGKKKIFKKWKALISEDQFYALMEYAQKYEELKILRGEGDIIKAKIGTLHSEIEGHKQEIEGHKQEIEGHKQEIEGHKQEIEGYRQEIEGYKQETEGYKSALSDFDLEKEEYEKRLNMFCSQQKSQEDKLLEMCQVLDRIYSSKVFKLYRLISIPLRFMRKRLK
jgi:LmbE family N-acetylglucosaminyl deacetylase/glycosyltransferase involved in cell wall biosynthesis